MYTSGDILFTSGDILFTSGDILYTSGDILFTSGDILYTSGDILFTSGDILYTSGDILFTSGDILYTSGDILFTSGDILFTSGDILYTRHLVYVRRRLVYVRRRLVYVRRRLVYVRRRLGDVLETSGDVLYTSGDVSFTSGDVLYTSGDISFTSGDVLYTTGEGQVSKGQVSEGQVSEGQVSKGQVSEGQVSEGQVSKGQVSEGQVKDRTGEGQVRTGEGQVSKGQVSEGQVKDSACSDRRSSSLVPIVTRGGEQLSNPRRKEQREICRKQKRIHLQKQRHVSFDPVLLSINTENEVRAGSGRRRFSGLPRRGDLHHRQCLPPETRLFPGDNSTLGPEALMEPLEPLELTGSDSYRGENGLGGLEVPGLNHVHLGEDTGGGSAKQFSFSRLICTPVPVGECRGNMKDLKRQQQADQPEEDWSFLRTTAEDLRQMVVQQNDQILMDQRTIRELTGKLNECESGLEDERKRS
ncbi:hypothetical protein F7725_006270 [Dissostichus mawsoni]|uniref:Uncharacterized protein n=1 Tax=Dissostichus mawsoni TaxID=36200 RepID=A0A7J5YTW0_DISMA|nr:hypothetical protein F7725_006270 [Dissostichus mawsoni]